jgi:hypothetical protein
MLKLEFELDDLKDISSGLKAGLNAAMASTMERTKAKSMEIAAKRLHGGLKHWSKGFAIDKVADGVWVVSMTGKLANMMEDGFGVGDIKKMLLEGNRAKANAKDGKKYVDVPLALDADAKTGNIGKTKITVQQFKNADELVKNISVSDWKKGGIKQESRITQRVKDVIKSRKAKNSESQYLTIRRVSEKSKGWPTNPFQGAHVFEELDNFLEKAFEQSLESLL